MRIAEYFTEEYFELKVHKEKLGYFRKFDTCYDCD